jgi:ribosome-associated protein
MISEIIKALEDKKAENIQVIDFKGQHALVDAFIVVSASSQRQIWAIVDAVEESVQGIAPFVKISGDSSSTWVSVDCGDIVVHVFDPQERALYQLEKLWAAYLKKTAS